MQDRRSTLERALGLFTDVRRGEGVTGLWMFCGAFLVLAAYYFVKPAREGFLAASGLEALSDMELKAYSSFGQTVLLLGVIPLYDRLSRRLTRRLLITWVPLFCVSNLIAFWALQPGLLIDRPALVGVGFYLWVGVFNVLIVAQFWSFAADLYGEERGRRLFPLIAVGATAGATFGAALSGELVDRGFVGAYTLLWIAALVLGAAVAVMRVAEARGDTADPNGEPSPSAGDLSGGLSLIFRHRYLAAAALLVFLLNWVNTNGENLLFAVVRGAVTTGAADQGLSGAEADAFVRDQTTAFYGNFYFWVNLIAFALQAFVVSRILKFGGFAPLLLLLPVLSLVSYAAMAVVPTLALIRTLKVAENATAYSVNNTAQQVLWLPTTPEMKYRAKAAVDTLFFRFGDGAAAATAFVGTSLLDVSVRTLFATNALLGVAWLVTGAYLAREYERRRRRLRRRSSSGPSISAGR